MGTHLKDLRARDVVSSGMRGGRGERNREKRMSALCVCLSERLAEPLSTPPPPNSLLPPVSPSRSNGELWAVLDPVECVR